MTAMETMEALKNEKYAPAELTKLQEDVYADLESGKRPLRDNAHGRSAKETGTTSSDMLSMLDGFSISDSLPVEETALHTMIGSSEIRTEEPVEHSSQEEIVPTPEDLKPEPVANEPPSQRAIRVSELMYSIAHGRMDPHYRYEALEALRRQATPLELTQAQELFDRATEETLEAERQEMQRQQAEARQQAERTERANRFVGTAAPAFFSGGSAGRTFMQHLSRFMYENREQLPLIAESLEGTGFSLTRNGNTWNIGRNAGEVISFTIGRTASESYISATNSERLFSYTGDGRVIEHRATIRGRQVDTRNVEYATGDNLRFPGSDLTGPPQPNADIIRRRAEGDFLPDATARQRMDDMLRGLVGENRQIGFLHVADVVDRIARTDLPLHQQAQLYNELVRRYRSEEIEVTLDGANRSFVTHNFLKTKFRHVLVPLQIGTHIEADLDGYHNRQLTRGEIFAHEVNNRFASFARNYIPFFGEQIAEDLVDHTDINGSLATAWLIRRIEHNGDFRQFANQFRQFFTEHTGIAGVDPIILQLRERD